MGNEQQGGTSHHFIMNPSNDESKQQERESPSGTKSRWQVVRDMSMNILSRKTTRLSLKQGMHSFVCF
jgi:hypothetical protein